jgi:phosphate transport system substrate-binding protein
MDIIYIIILLLIIIFFYLSNKSLKNKENFAGFGPTGIYNAYDNFFEPDLQYLPKEKAIIIPSKYDENIDDENIDAENIYERNINKQNIKNEIIICAGTPYMIKIFDKIKKIYFDDTKVIIKYSPIGSVEGIQELKKGKFDFCTTTVKYKQAATENNYAQFPIMIGGVVPIINLPGIKPGTLILSGIIIAKIYLKIITTWNHQDIIDLNKYNPEVIRILEKIENKNIITVLVNVQHGLNYCLSRYLTTRNEIWKDKIGVSDLFISKIQRDNYTLYGKNDVTISNAVNSKVGAIGYVDYNYIYQNKLNYAILRSSISTNILYPSKESFLKYYNESLDDNDNGDGWPIIIIVYCLININPTNIKQSNLTINFFKWLYKNYMTKNFIDKYTNNGKDFYDYRGISEKQINYIEDKILNNVTTIGDININLPLAPQIERNKV